MIKGFLVPKRLFVFDNILLVSMIVSMCSCLFMVAITVMDVFARYFIRKPIPGVIELNEVLLICVVFLGLGLSQKDKAQIRAELFISYLSPKWRKGFDLFSLLFAFAFWTVLFVQSTTKGWQAFLIGEYREGLLKFPVWPARWALAFGILLISVQLVRDIFACIVSKDGFHLDNGGNP